MSDQQQAAVVPSETATGEASVETKPVVAVHGEDASQEPAVPKEKLSPQFHALARREKALVKKAQEFKATEESIKAKTAEFQKYETMLAE